jgi:DNA polymerase-1
MVSAADSGKPVVLVDGSSYLFRAYHALPELTTSDGHPTGAVRGVISMLRKLANDYAGSPIAVVFDASGRTFRDDIYPQYKANRAPMPDDLRAQIAPIHDMIRAMGLPLLMVPGVEADDVIGTLAREATERERRTIVSTSDKDMAQLVSDHVTLVNTMTGTTLDRAGVHEKFGVHPEQIVDYLALMGDSVDNIPGVAKVGPKTAAKWLAEYHTLDTVIARADEVKGKVGENLRDALGHLPMSRELATIRCDVELDVGIEALVAAPADVEALRTLFERFEFRAWAEELGGSVTSQVPEAAPNAVTKRDYECVLSRERLAAWVETLLAAPLAAVDTETTSIDYMLAELVGVSFSVAPGEGAYVPFGHRYPGAPDQLERGHVLETLRPWLEGAQHRKVVQNLKYDTSVLARYGITLRGAEFDTMLESYVYDSVGVRHNMDAMADKYLGVATVRYEDVAGKGAKALTFDQVGLEAAADYAAEDADITLRLHEWLWPRLRDTGRLEQIFRNLEMPLVGVLSRMERHGTLVDGTRLEAQGRELEVRMAELKERAWGLAGEQFNLDSPKQLQVLFYEKLDLPVLRKTPGGAPSTAEPVLLDLARDYELPQVILDYRGLAKLKSTYTDKLPLQINAGSGRIHTSYHQAVAATGRLSSSDPNLQNIPIRTAEGRRIRQAFIAPPGMCLVAADYSQIELRIMAHLSGDAGLNTAFERDQDIHRATAAEVFGVPLDGVSDDQRRSAKAINFGLIYGMSAFGLGRQLGISRTLAQEYIDRYFARYPGVREYMDRTRAEARERGYVETLFGRRLYVP